MAYEKSNPVEAGKAAVALIWALKDGLQLDQDSDEMVDFLLKVTAAVDEFQADTDSAVGYFIAGAAEEFGDRRMSLAPPTT